MAKTDFAIERPRKISISIQGYDARQRVQQQQQRHKERKQRMERKQAQACGPTAAVVAAAAFELPVRQTPAPPKDGAGEAVPTKRAPAVTPISALTAPVPAVNGHEPTLLELKLRAAFAGADAVGEKR